MEQALDIHLAMWSSSETLTPSDKRRVQAERVRRKRDKQRVERVGILTGPEGITPIQQEKMVDLLVGQRGAMGGIAHTWSSASVHSLCKSFGVEVVALKDRKPEQAAKRIIHNSTMVFAFPRGEHGEMWDWVRQAKHRNLPVIVVMPNGERR